MPKVRAIKRSKESVRRAHERQRSLGWPTIGPGGDRPIVISRPQAAPQPALGVGGPMGGPEQFNGSQASNEELMRMRQALDEEMARRAALPQVEIGQGQIMNQPQIEIGQGQIVPRELSPEEVYQRQQMRIRSQLPMGMREHERLEMGQRMAGPVNPPVRAYPREPSLAEIADQLRPELEGSGELVGKPKKKRRMSAVEDRED